MPHVQAYGQSPNPHKASMHRRMDREADLWTKRPLEAAVLDYAGEATGYGLGQRLSGWPRVFGRYTS